MSTPDAATPRPRHRRSRPVLVLAWLLATVLAGTVAWWAVTAVGGERGGDRTGLVSLADVEQRLAEQGGSGASGGATDGVTDGPTADGTGATTVPEPTASDSPGSGAAAPDGTPSPDAAPPPAPTTAPTTEPAAEPAATTAPPAAAQVARTWDVTGGQVAAVCTGATIGLLYATPSDGWGVEVERAGPAELEVQFSRGDEESRLRAECLAGTPEVTRADDDRGRGGGDDDGGGGGDDGDGD